MIKNKESYKSVLVSFNNTWRYTNIGIDQIAGYLRTKDFNVDLFYHHERIDYDKIISKMKFDYDLYGFSINSANYKCSCKVAKYIKEKFPEVTIVFGGGYPTRYYREIYEECDFVDYIILGDGERPFEDLLNHIIFDESLEYKSYIATKDDMEGKLAYCNDIIDYLPAFDYFENDTYKRNRRKDYCIQSKNNVCTGRCTFCTERKGRIVYKDLDLIIENIKIVHTKYGVKKFFFTDDNILDPNNDVAKKRIWELCERIEKLGYNLVFKCYIKANSLHDNPEDNRLLEKMSSVGFKTFFVGLESGNEEDLRLYNKLTTVEENRNIVNMLRRYEIAPQIGFINFNPYSTPETIKKNYYFLTEIGMNNIFMYVCSYMRVYKYTQMYEMIKRDNLILDGYDYLDDSSKYAFSNSKIQEIFNFMDEYMLKRVRNFDFEFDWLYSFYLECKKINPEAIKFHDKLEKMKQEQLEKIKVFFYHLFVETDIDWCINNVEEFLNYFESSSKDFMDIHCGLLDLYI